MKISDVNQEGQTNQLIQQGEKPAPLKKNQNAREMKGSSIEDPVNLSSEAKELRMIHDILEATPDVRTEQVEALRKAIQNCQYEIQDEAVAGQMIKDALLEFKK